MNIYKGGLCTCGCGGEKACYMGYWCPRWKKMLADALSQESKYQSIMHKYLVFVIDLVSFLTFLLYFLVELIIFMCQ